MGTTDLFSSNPQQSLTRELEYDQESDTKITFEEVWNESEKTKCVNWIQTNDYKKVCLQFPDSLLEFSIQISEELKEQIQTAEFYILGDTSYGSCCVDEVAAAHVYCDSIIHFGRACLSKVSRLPVLYVFPHSKCDLGELTEKIRLFCANEKDCVVLFYDLEYLYLIGRLRESLRDHENVKIAEVRQTGEVDCLFWKLPENIDNCRGLFIGGNNQLFFNIRMSLSGIHEWYSIDPQLHTDITEEKLSASKWMRKRFFYIEKCKDAQSIGIVVGTLTADGYLGMIAHMKELTKKRGIRSYIISVGKVNTAKLANFMEIDCFVLVGCPENAEYNSKEFYKPLISVFELELALNPKWKDVYPDKYSTEFKDLLPNGIHHREFNELDLLNIENDVSLVTGQVRNNVAQEIVEETKDGAVQLKSNLDLMNSTTSMDSLRHRSWQGLDPALGQDEFAKIEPGRSGIAMGYEATDGSSK